MNTSVTNNTTTAGNPITELIAKVLDKFDTNKDKQLDATEFGSFLSGLLEGKTGMTADPAAAEAKEFAPPPFNYALMHGFDDQNYYNPDVETMKYQFARIAADHDPRTPGALDRIAADPRFKSAFPNARAVAFDKIDFGGQLSEGGGRGVPVGIVDVGEAFHETTRCGPAWQWLDQANG